MKRTIFLFAAIASFLALPASAHHINSVTGKVEDFFQTERIQVPHTKRLCSEEEGADAEDVLGGMVIGGIFGDILSGGDDKATGAGAIIGGMIAAEENKGSVSTVCQDVTTYSQEQRNVYSYSTITFEVDGELFTIRFQRY
ncbi:MAG: hypothetical protein ACPGO7_05155 [Alphaproteobacteria bacterium]